MTAMDGLNKSTWRTPSSLRLYRNLAGYSDEGERVALDMASGHIVGKRLLDLGVGGGRTAELLAARTAFYVGIDYTPELVAVCRARLPGLRIEEADARDLSRFGDASFDMVMFSFNGIDAVDPAGRLLVMAEAARVLVPGGLFLFSTFNVDGPGFASRASNRRIEWSANPVRVAYSAAKYGIGGALGWWRVLRGKRLEQRYGDHALLLHKAHDFGILVHATSKPHLLAQLAASGFAAEPVIIGSSGAIMVGPEFGNAEEYVHILARKPA